MASSQEGTSIDEIVVNSVHNLSLIFSKELSQRTVPGPPRERRFARGLVRGGPGCAGASYLLTNFFFSTTPSSEQVKIKKKGEKVEQNTIVIV